MKTDPIAALEIGTSKICVLVGEAREDGNIMITGMGNCPSRGVRKGVIVDLEMAAAGVKAAVQEAESSGSVDIREVYLLVNGEHIRGSTNEGNVPVFDPARGITQEDIEDVTEIARAINLPVDNEPLHTIPQTYSVDGQAGVINPLGMHGASLSLNMLIVHGSRNILNNTIQAARNVGLEVMDVAFAGLTSSMAVLRPEQKECGVTLIDIGAGTTTFTTYARNAIASMGAIGVGGDHINNDISQGFTISLSRAETIKHEFGAALVDPSDRFRRITIPADVGCQACSVSAADLNTIINARMDETFRIIRKELERQRLIEELGHGVVLTGGGARLKGIETLAEQVFGVASSIGTPRSFSGLSAANEGPEYASALGLIRYAFRTSAKRSGGNVSLRGLIKRWFAG